MAYCSVVLFQILTEMISYKNSSHGPKFVGHIRKYNSAAAFVSFSTVGQAILDEDWYYFTTQHQALSHISSESTIISRNSPA